MLQDRIAVRLTPEPPPPPPEPSGFLPMLLPRHGQRPLGFAGRLLFSAGNRGTAPRCWHEVAVYEREDGGLVAAIRQGARLDGLAERSWAFACETPEEARAAFAAHDPLPPLPLDALTDVPNAGHNAAELLEAAAAQRRLWHALLEAVLGPAPHPHHTPAGTAPGPDRGDHP
jgi:hypothetical protein